MKIIIFGLGSIGKRHALLLQKNFNHKLYAYRHKKGKLNELGIPEIYTRKELEILKPDVAFITNPTNQHTKYALICAKLGINLFLEKPIASDFTDIPELIKIVKEKNLKTYIGYDLRFHPAIIDLKKEIEKDKPVHVSVYASSYLPNWRKGINHLKHYSAIKSQGGGVILDLSHEIDYAHYLCGSFKNVQVNAKKISDVTSDAEDFADILIEYNNGIFGNIHINFLSRLHRREIIVDFHTKTIVADLVNHTLTSISDQTNKHEYNFDIDTLYLNQLNHFFDNLSKDTMMNNLEENIPIFKEILDIRRHCK